MNKDQENPVRQKGKSFPSWAAVAAILGAGAIPCPSCGTPLGLHLLPLAALFLAVRAFTRRGARNARPDAPPPAVEATSMARQNPKHDGKKG